MTEQEMKTVEDTLAQKHAQSSALGKEIRLLAKQLADEYKRRAKDKK